jgi:hypothetical protein
VKYKYPLNSPAKLICEILKALYLFINDQPSKAGHAEEESDGEQNVGDEAQDHIRPVDLNPKNCFLKGQFHENFHG